MLTPRGLLIELIKTLPEAELGWNPGAGNGGVRLMPTLYNEGSYSELERRLDDMRDSVAWRSAWWHLTQRHLFGKVSSLEVPVRRTMKGPYPLLPGRSELMFIEAVLSNRSMRVRVYQWDKAVADEQVELGLDCLLATMYDGNTQRIQLPLEFLYRALGKEMPDAKPTHQPAPSIVSTASLAVA